MSTDKSLLDKLTDYAESIGYRVVVRDTSAGPDSIPPSLVFLEGPEGVTHSLHVELVENDR